MFVFVVCFRNVWYSMISQWSVAPPQVEPSMVTKRRDTPDESGVAFGFVIDNVQDIRNVSATHGVFFKICVDPEISVFPNDKIKPYLQKGNEYLTISVSYFH